MDLVEPNTGEIKQFGWLKCIYYWNYQPAFRIKILLVDAGFQGVSYTSTTGVFKPQARGVQVQV